MSPKLWVILTGGILGIVMMRLVIGKLLALVERYPALVDGAFVIIAWVGIKLLIEYAHTEGYIAFEVPKWISLGLIVVIFGVALGYALIDERRAERTAAPTKESRTEPAAAAALDRLDRARRCWSRWSAAPPSPASGCRATPSPCTA